MPDLTATDSASRKVLSAAQAELQVHLSQLTHWSGRATPAQVAAVAGVEGVIVLAAKQQTSWAKLRLIALRALGMFLRSIERQGRGRPLKKMSDADILHPTYADLGITDRHVAADALNVARIEEHIFREYMKTDEPTFKGLVRFAADYRYNPETGSEDGYFLIPPDVYNKLKEKIGGDFDFDACPHPRAADFDSLNPRTDWHPRNFVNPPFLRKHGINNQGPTPFVRRAIEEYQRGKDSALVLPSRSFLNLVLEQVPEAEIFSLGRPGFLHTRTGKPDPSPPPTIGIVLRGSQRQAAPNILYQDPDKIVEWLMADPEKASKVCTSLLERSSGSSMSIMYFPGHCIGNSA